MATFTDHVRVVIDVVADNAKRGIGKFKSDIASAEGAVGKVKAGMSSALGAVGANAGLLAATAGAAFVTFGAKAVGAFTDVANKAREVGAATGLATEDASRWVAVADDFGIGAEAIAGGVGKITKTLDATKWEKYGIATRDAAGNARDANDILLDTLDTLGRIDNAAERSRAGQELLGKGYANLAPLVGKTREEYEALLGSVSDAQAVTDDEAQKALEASQAFDDFKDAVHDLSIELGAELAPAAADAATALADVIGWLSDLGVFKLVSGTTNAVSTWFDEVADAGFSLREFIRTGDISSDLVDVADAWEASTDAVRGFDRAQLEGLTSFDAVHQAVLTATGDLGAANIVAVEWAREQRDAADATDEHTDAVLRGSREIPPYVQGLIEMGEAAQAAKTDQQRLAEAIELSNTALADMRAEAFSGERAELRQQELWASIADQIGAVGASFADVQAAYKKGAAEGEQAQRDQQREVRRLQGLVLDLLETYEDIPLDKVTRIIAEISSGDMDRIQAALDELTADRFIHVGVVMPTLHDAFQTSQTTIAPGVAPTAPQFIGGTQQTTIIYPTGSTPSGVVSDGRLYERRNGVRLS